MDTKNDFSLYGDRAAETHMEGYSCSQSVVTSLCEEFGIDRVTALKMSGAFGSGIGHSTETCGAITGAMMLIGMKYGKILPGVTPEGAERSHPKCYEVAQEFLKRFIDEHGAFKCRDLLGVDTNTEEGQKCVDDNDLYYEKCNKIFIRRGAELIAEILKEEEFVKVE